MQAQINQSNATWRRQINTANTATQNEANRNHNLAIAALERTTSLDLQSNAQKQALYGLLGQFGMQVFSKFA